MSRTGTFQEGRGEAAAGLAIRLRPGPPKYQQIVASVQAAIRDGRLRSGDAIPSMNALQARLGVARETVFKAYRELRARGIVSSHPGKGYYVSSVPARTRHHVFLLLDGLTAYKEVLFDSFRQALGDDAVVDVYFHHFAPDVFRTLVSQAAGRYTDYVVMPLADEAHRAWLRETLGGERVYVLDVGWELYRDEYPCVCQDFRGEVYASLRAARDLMAKYDELVLLWGRPGHAYGAAIRAGVSAGLRRFCKEAGLRFRTAPSAEAVRPRAGQCFFTSYDFDLVRLVQAARGAGLEIGRQAGIVSFNETPLMAVVADGIATISTDFEAMGRTMASLVAEGRDDRILNPFRLIRRRSL